MLECLGPSNKLFYGFQRQMVIMQALLAEDAAEKEKGQSQKSKVKKAKAKGECQPADLAYS